MKAGGYSMKTVADLNSKSCFERERLREREREARAQMTFEADQRLSQDMMNSAPLFGEIVRVNPKSNDKERQQIERKLGRFEDVKHLLADQDVTNLFGVDGQPPPSPAPNVSSSGSSSSVASHEFKKPNACFQAHTTKSSHHHHHHHHHSNSAQRNALAKPNDGKMTYASRGNFYGGSSSKHCNVLPTLSMKSSAGGNSTVNSSFVSGGNIGGIGNNSTAAAANYHYGSMSSKASSSHEYAVRIQQTPAKNLPKINCELRDSLRIADSGDDGASVSQTNVENILDEMTSGLRTPLTAIAATPRKEVESKFTFNPISGKVESLLPLPRTSVDKGYKANVASDLLGPGGGRGPVMSTTNILQPYSSTLLSGSGSGGNTLSKNAYGYTSSVAEMALSSANKEKNEPTAIPCLKSDLSLSEDTDDGDGAENDNDEDDGDCDDDEDGDDEEEEQTQRRRQHARSNVADEKDSNKYKMMSSTAFATKKEPSASTPSNAVDELRKCETAATNDSRNSSSSDDSDSDSGSESEDSSSDSPSPPSLPLPVVTEQEESKHRWNLENFLPPSAHNSQAYRRQNCAKLNANDSDSSTGRSNGTRRKSRLTSCSTSDSDNDNRASSRKLATDAAKTASKTGSSKSSGSGANTSLATTAVNAGSGSSAAVAGSNDNGLRSKYRLRSSSYSQSSDDEEDDDSDRGSSYSTSNSIRNGRNNKNYNSNNVGIGSNTSTTTTASNGSMMVASSTALNSSSCANSFVTNVSGGGGGAVNNSCGNGGNMTVVGVVRPHQRKPPSPQIFHHNGRSRNGAGGGLRDLSPATNEDRYSTFVQQRALHLGGQAAPEPQCELSANRGESDMILKNVNRALINDPYQMAARNNNRNNASTNTGASTDDKCSSATINSNNRSHNKDGDGDDNDDEDNNDYHRHRYHHHHHHHQDDDGRAGTLGSGGKAILPTTTSKAANTSSKVGRKSKSPAIASNDSPAKKKRGRKRTIKVPDLSDSDEDVVKTKAAPEKKRPGRPPLKRNDPAAEDADWNASSRRKMAAAEKFASSTAAAANVWCDRERRRSSLRMSSFTTVDSDSDPEILTATVKPTARVMPAVKRKDGGGGANVRLNRDSSCESIRNDGDFNAISNASMKSSGGAIAVTATVGGGAGMPVDAMTKAAQESPPKLDVECIAVQDKKKSDTLRKLFSRREEGGGKTGGKGKGGKGKCGVIVMESEVERKLLQRSSDVVSPATMAALSPSPPPSSSTNLQKMQDRVPDMTHVAISSPKSLRSNDDDDDGGKYSAMSRVSSAANNGAARNVDRSGGGENCTDQIPKLTYNEAGKPSLMCKIDLSKIPYILAKKRSEDVRIKCELPDTRQQPSTNAMLDVGGGCVKPVPVDTVNVPLIEHLSDRRRNNAGAAATSVPSTSSAADDGCGQNVNVSDSTATAAGAGDLYYDRSKQNQRSAAAPAASPSSRNATRKKHSSKKTKNSKRKQHYADELRAAVQMSPTTSAADTNPTVEEDNNVSIFATTSTVHTPSVDTTDMDSSLSSDSETRKMSAAGLGRMRKRSTTASNSASLAIPAGGSDTVRSSLITPCYGIDLNQVHHQNINAAVVDRSSADDDSWNGSESSCSSNCSASPTSCPGGGSDKYFKVGKRSSQYRACGKKRKKTLRNEHSQRHPALSDCGVGSATNLIHIPNTAVAVASGHDRNSIPDSVAAASFNGYHQVAISDLVRPPVPSHHGIYYSYLEHKASEEFNSESDNVSPNLYLMEAKRLKHAADTERDSVAQGMQYLEAILSFVLTGHVLERKNQMDTAFNMYSETLKLIVYISKKFRTLCTNVTPSSIPNKIAILSLRCESILNLKLYTMRENEVKDVHNTVADYFSKHTAEACLISNAAGMPSPHSPTPSPASSVGSNSSGYSSGDRRQMAAQGVMVPSHLHVALQKQHDFYSNLIASFSYWEEADKLIFSGGNKDFFIELDRFCGPLTLHSSLKDLVHYVRVGIQRLKAIISHNHGV